MHLIDMDNATRTRGGCLWTTELADPLGGLGPLVAGVLECDAGTGLALLEFGHGPRSGRGIDAILAATGARVRDGSHPLHTEVHQQLAAYASGELLGFELTLHLIGTAFQRRVWRELLKIPSGSTTTYQALGERVGSPGGSRAVGGANGANRIAVVIPCHRVIASDATLGGYGGGLERKLRLLDLEGASVARRTPGLWTA